MNRLQSELHRLYLARPSAPADDDAASAASAVPIDAQDGVRAMVMELARPASWALLARVWQGVQAELELPAPAIAVSGVDGHQLWFSLADPVPVAEAHGFLESLRVRYLPEIAPGRIGLWPDSDASGLRQARHARMVPARQEHTGDWSAFVAPDLAPVFDDTPWLDIPPGEEGQAALLRGLASMKRSAFEAASARLGPATPAAGSTSADALVAPALKEAEGEDPRRFLRKIMNDDTVALALRIEAAKSLLPYSDEPPRKPGA